MLTIVPDENLSFQSDSGAHVDIVSVVGQDSGYGAPQKSMLFGGLPGDNASLFSMPGPSSFDASSLQHLAQGNPSRLPSIQVTPPLDTMRSSFDSPSDDDLAQLMEFDAFDSPSIPIGNDDFGLSSTAWNHHTHPATPSMCGSQSRQGASIPVGFFPTEQAQMTTSDPVWFGGHSTISSLDFFDFCTPSELRNLIPMEQHFSPYSSSSTSPLSSAPHSPLLHPHRTHSPASSTCPTPPLTRQSSPATATPSMSAAKTCSHCKATSTPLWRRDPNTHLPLCNACGLYLQHRQKMRPQALIDADGPDEEEVEGCYGDASQAGAQGPQCSHCHTRNTSVWRRSKDGLQVCNACGVYQRLRGKPRPLRLRRNRIKPRTKRV
jgi:Zn ribbon nucleic-acid-binding protein